MTALTALAVGRGNEVRPFVWTGDIPQFGGFSGIELTDGGQGMVVVSDAGYLAEAHIERDADGRIVGITDVIARTFLQNHGQAVNGFQGDAEAVRLDASGYPVVAFESYVRIARFPTPDMKPVPLNAWDRFRDLWSNEAIEALAIDASGGMVALLEMPLADPAGYRTLIFHDGQEWADGPILATDGAFQATDADFGPDGVLYVLERRLSLLQGYATRISAYPARGGGWGLPRTVAETRLGEFGDFEGMDVWRNSAGKVIATLITDDNFMPDSATVIAEFPIDP